MNKEFRSRSRLLLSLIVPFLSCERVRSVVHPGDKNKLLPHSMNTYMVDNRQVSIFLPAVPLRFGLTLNWALFVACCVVLFSVTYTLSYKM